MAIGKRDKRPRFPVPNARFTHLCTSTENLEDPEPFQGPASGPPRLVSTPFDQQLIRITTGLLVPTGPKDWYRS